MSTPTDALQPKAKKSGSRSWLVDFMNLLKAFIGLNFMYISFAISQAGVTRGAIGLVLIAYITYISCLMLVKVKYQLPEEVRAANPQLTYGDLARLTVGPRAELIVNFALILTQFGYCTGYLIFLSHTIHDLLNSTWPIWGFVLLPLPVLIIIAQLRSVRSLGPFSALANVSLMIGFVSVVVYISAHFEYRPTTPPISAFPIFFGQVTAALEGIGLVLPVEASMKEPKYFPLVMGLALGCLTVVLTTVGILGFVTFGEDTESIILMNMQGSGLIAAVKIVLCCGILFTYPLQLVPVVQSFEGWVAGGPAVPAHVIAHEIGHSGIEVEQEIQRDEAEEQEELARDNSAGTLTRQGSKRPLFATEWYQILARFIIVLSTALVAMFAGKSFGLFQSLIGNLGAALLAYTGPSFLHFYALRDQLTIAEKIRDGMIFTLGILGSIIGTSMTLREIFKPEAVVEVTDEVVRYLS